MMCSSKLRTMTLSPCVGLSGKGSAQTNTQETLANMSRIRYTLLLKAL